MVSTRATSRAASAVPESTPPPPDSPSAAESSALLTQPPTTPSTRRRTASSKQQPSTAIKKRAGRPSSASASAPRDWSHTPSRLTLLWLAVSLPLVAWDTGYMLGRPRTFAGGDWHWPIWVPYALYAQIDHVYSPRAYAANNGFSGAQSALNVVETVMYLVYMWIFWSRADVPAAGDRRSLAGRPGGLAVLVGFSAAVMTLSKTVLYNAHEYYTGFDNVGHNSAFDLITLWILPNCPWIIFPTYMVWSIGGNILDGLAQASK
ncbi:hypothetical protein EDB81DRAFT_153966 [Dactylonectria macrodidyma]|uniref:C6 transcription factor n=1 Tax=Dactylonectria macrodidyma TaxID=307937 RepID=A0A9P9JGD2_9HYPO|nr:hypothetical protein EDB81DRAFT_153966 [Dactylonectria macrodidyma]